MLAIVSTIHREQDSYAGNQSTKVCWLTMIDRILALVLVSLFVGIACPSRAVAASAVFTSSMTLEDAEIAALSTRGDGAGLLIGLNQSFSLIMSSPFATSRSDTVMVFTLRPGSGTARASIRFGVFNDGAPIIVSASTVNSGSNLSVGNLFQRGCNAFGGCDYIEIVTTRTTGGAYGVEVDYVTINGEVVEVAAPTPGPGAWAMMLIGFWLVSLRMKARLATKRALYPPCLSSPSSV